MTISDADIMLWFVDLDDRKSVRWIYAVLILYRYYWSSTLRDYVSQSSCLSIALTAEYDLTSEWAYCKFLMTLVKEIKQEISVEFKMKTKKKHF